ncbi:MAG: response regulator transcription factor [candidate division WS1 bacterium]|jgi:DNA-binding response OmpR family regulator|nr:response regulator transcription factor [candidate division WS1 bacterium]
MRKLLIVDDDENLAWAVRKKFESLGFEVLTAVDGRSGAELVEKEQPSLVILDLNLPDVDGLDVCRYLRRRSNIPIVMLTGRAEDSDAVVGLELGADDYVTKPFSLNELAARVRAVLRRSVTEPIAASAAAEPATPRVVCLEASGLAMDPRGKRVWVDDQEVQLTPTEFRLLQTLLENCGRVVSQQDLLRAGWDYEDSDTHLVEVHIGNLRGKVETRGKPQRIKTVRGFGYRIDADA